MTSLVLLGAGLVTLGAAAVLMPAVARPTPHPATPEVERALPPVGTTVVQAVSATGSLPPPPIEIGGIATAPPAEGAGSASSAQEIASASPSASASNVGSIAVAPPARSTTIVASPASAAAPSSSAIGGGPPATDVADGGVAENGDATVAAGDGGAVPYPATYLAAPVYGAPPSSTSSAGPTTYGATGDAAALWSGGASTSGGGGGGGNAAIVNPRASISTSFLLTMSDTDDPERAWTSLTQYLRPSDVVVAHVAGAGPNDVAYMDWGDRVHTDTPLVQYLVAVDDASKVNDLVKRGLPMNVNGLGLAQTNGFDGATLNALSSAVHGAGRRFFVSASTTSPVPLAQIGARADVVELVLSASDPASAANEASSASTQLRGGGAPLVFVRLPSGATSTSTASTFLSTLAGAAPNVGVSIPNGVGTGFLGDLRSSP